MTNAQIEKELSQNNYDEKAVQISFKTRNAITGLFIKAPDYAELKSKNFWRIVVQANMEAYTKSRDINLAKIFNGMEFTKLSSR
jgi:hypothetical protein